MKADNSQGVALGFSISAPLVLRNAQQQKAPKKGGIGPSLGPALRWPCPSLALRLGQTYEVLP